MILEKQRKTILKLENVITEHQIIHMKKELYTIKNKKVKNSTIDTKFDKSCNKISRLETSNRFEE